MCIRDRMYIGTMKHSVCTRVGEHSRYYRLGQPEKSAIAEHALANADHRIRFDETLLSAVGDYFPRLHMESILIHKHAAIVMNQRGESIALSTLWHLSLIHI